MSATTVDARHLLCPLPVIRTQDAVAKCQPGEHLQVVCTDPGVLHDIPTWCRVHGHVVCAIEHTDNEIIFEIQIGDSI